MFIVMVNVLRTRARLKLLWWLILVVSVGLSVKAIYDYRMGVLILGGDRIAGAIGGLFENPNDLALHLVTFLPIVIALAFATKNPFSKLVYLLAALTLVGGTVVTFSRGGFLGLIVVVATLAWRLMKQNRVLVLAAMVLLMGCFLVLSPGAYRQRISTTADDSATARTNELKRSIYVTIRHPLLGAGMDNFVVFSNTEHATHNAYTQVSSEIGIPAAVFYVLFLVAAVKRVKRIPHPREVDGKRKELAYLAIGIHASLVGYMVNSFFASVAYLWYVYYLVAYAICVWRLWEVDRSVESSSTS
jgi:putative inorganic carbon (HCO3(-)) transporter